MDFTFGIITNSGNDDMVNLIIDSIENQNISKYEVVIVGGEYINRKNVVHIPFDESIKPKWITKKKNLITQNAKYENIVYMHDYVSLCDGWYDGFLKNGDDFKVCMNKIQNQDGERYRDWVLWYRDLYDAINDDVTRQDINNIIHKAEFFLPYDMIHLSKYMYFSGAYWVAKKDVMLENTLNEIYCWGQGEDVEWSRRIKTKYKFSMNSDSTVKFLKYKEPVWTDCSEETIKILNKIK